MQMILRQEDRDEAVRGLLMKLSEVYNFMNEDRLAEIEKMQVVCGKLARQTQECADFIVHYADRKSACESNALCRNHLTPSVVSFTGERLAKDLLKETETVIKSYNDALDALMQQFRDHAVRSTVLQVYRIGKRWPQILPNLD